VTEALPEGWDCHVHVFDAAEPARAGHYRPVTRPLEVIEATAQAQGVGHLVLVQPSVYGSDNGLLLRALARSPGRHRAVVVLDEHCTDRELDALHAAGVRGARLNLVSPVGEGSGDVHARFSALAPRLRERDWHLQWYAAAERLPEIAAWHGGTGVRCVLDHLAGLRAGLPEGHVSWNAMRRLADQGAWVKLSGWYRLNAQAPYEVLDDTVRRVHTMTAGRCVWGSDWPHTAFAPDALPDYTSTWVPAVRALGDEAAAAVRNQARRLYD
jgi:predicted TIM-barrel fold metal-dependent hydrolase